MRLCLRSASMLVALLIVVGFFQITTEGVMLKPLNVTNVFLQNGYILVLAPVVASGRWTWTGYNFVNDTSVQLLLAQHLPAHGFDLPAAAR